MHKLLLTIANIALGITVTGLGGMYILKSPPVNAAERISFSLPVLGEFHLSTESLEIFAKEKRITPEFAHYTKHLDEESLDNFQQVLQTNFDVDPITVYRLTSKSMGEDFLRRLGNIIYTHPERNGIYAIRSALISAAGEPDGLTAINFLRHFPTDEMQLNTNSIFALVKEAKSFFRYRDTTVEAIAEQTRKDE